MGSAKYAVNDYLIEVQPEADTRLAFDFMSASAYQNGDDCDGARYADPLIPFTSLPVTERRHEHHHGRVGSKVNCPSGELAWYYDVPASPKTVDMCPNACDLITNAAAGAKVNTVGGCEATVIFK